MKLDPTLVQLYNDTEYQMFLEELFNYNGTFNIEYNIGKKVEYLRNTTFGFASLGVVKSIEEVSNMFVTDENHVVTGSRLLSFLETLTSLETKSSTLLTNYISTIKIPEVKQVVEMSIKEPRITIMNRLKQNKFFTLTKLFPYSYVHNLLSPFVDISPDMFSREYKISINYDMNYIVGIRNKKYEDNFIWLDDITYDTISEITRYYKLIKRVLYEKEFTTITSLLDLLILYLNWKDMKNGIDKSEELEYIESFLTLRTMFPYGYVNSKNIRTSLSKLYVDMEIQTKEKPMRIMIGREFVSNVLRYNLVTEEKILQSVLESVSFESRKELLTVTENGNKVPVYDLLKSLELKNVDIYQKLFKNVISST